MVNYFPFGTVPPGVARALPLGLPVFGTIDSLITVPLSICQLPVPLPVPRSLARGDYKRTQSR